jgi:integrase
VFCREDGSPLDPGGLSGRLHTILKNARLPQVRIYDLRHTAATLYLARGENPKVVQELLGRSTVGITLDVYSHVTPATHKAAAAKKQALFNPN